jgi:hypothetical protein
MWQNTASSKSYDRKREPISDMDAFELSKYFPGKYQPK